VAKQLGVLKRKLKKNLGRLTRNSSFKCGGGNASDERDGNAREARQQQQQQQQPQQQQPQQAFILAALLHTNKPLPYQNEMIENYLQVRKRATSLTPKGQIAKMLPPELF
jgi:transcription initiation factor TFIID subunit TAF12